MADTMHVTMKSDVHTALKSGGQRAPSDMKIINDTENTQKFHVVGTDQGH